MCVVLHKFKLRYGKKFYPKFIASLPSMPDDELSFDELQRARLALLRDVQLKAYSSVLNHARLAEFSYFCALN